MVLLPIEKVPLGISTTWYFYLMVLLPSIHYDQAVIKEYGNTIQRGAEVKYKER